MPNLRHKHPGRRRFCFGVGAGLTAILLAKSTALGASAAPRRNAEYPDVIGKIRRHIAKEEDTLLDIARDNGLGYVETVAANPGVDPWVPGAGTAITLPTAHVLPSGPREGVLLNLIDQRLYYFPSGGGAVESFPIGTGQEGWDTPTGSTKIVRKKRDPTWYVPQSIRKEDPDLPKIVPPGPENPLGQFALYLGWPAYLIHGTNNPWGVGRRVSHGCIRLYPEDIAEKFPQIPVGTPVTVVRQEMKTGWLNDQLMLEVHPNPTQADNLEARGTFAKAKVPELAYRVVSAAGDCVDRIDWRKVRKAARERRGLPVPVLRSS